MTYRFLQKSVEILIFFYEVRYIVEAKTFIY